ncbi:type II secretion system protein [candidate division WWE3 bacterium]|uniref:Type II secretion system protein n=1 Tax=candidate division WWE3 bacterium TaxID=2053526 RepID=A0A955LJG0_UNCKA|nr:type II secretion system protein [candidate division WWE3 bacterium]
MEKIITTIKNNEGFTLVELLVTITVLGVITGVMITTFISLSSAYDKADVITQINHEGLRSMEQIVRMVRNSYNATVNGTTELILDIPDDSSNVEYSTNGSCKTVTLTHVVNQPSSPNVITKVASDCAGTPSCSALAPCSLTSSDVSVNNLDFTLKEGGTDPDLVTITFDLEQGKDSSLNLDTAEKSSLEFVRNVLTRGY